ncbi:hypothetical protein PGT21_002586 [Puccinia graminis f. sp. tritici]|uniref:Uncharacterized protein n=1 Tax=Puccinia graminis f. sp. tritici TaxID=56615 RepID=A0A5B0QEY3_PUCGR|nr:hypothetical protein PGT21_002586 [Puccinia graminis f. sp. tritici]
MAEGKTQQPPKGTTYLLTFKESSTLRRVLGVLYPRARVSEKNVQTVSLAIKRKAHNSLAGRFDAGKETSEYWLIKIVDHEVIQYGQAGSLYVLLVLRSSPVHAPPSFRDT